MQCYTNMCLLYSYGPLRPWISSLCVFFVVVELLWRGRLILSSVFVSRERKCPRYLCRLLRRAGPTTTRPAA